MTGYLDILAYFLQESDLVKATSLFLDYQENGCRLKHLTLRRCKSLLLTLFILLLISSAKY